MKKQNLKQFDAMSPEYKEILDHSRELKGQYGMRDRAFEKYERMYNMKWDCDVKRQGVDTIKPTTSPTARNKVLGAWRLLISQDPRFSVVSDIAGEQEAETYEKFITQMWSRAGKVNGRPLHYDIILSMLLYGESHVALNTINDYKLYNPKDTRVDKVAKLTPIVFDVWNPRTGYPEFDKFGLSAYYREQQVEKSWVRINYKELLEQEDWARELSGSGTVTLKTFYDLKKYCVMVNNRILVCCEHGLPNIPISVTRSDGSQLFERPEDNTQPLLYSLAQSRLWDRQNLYLTVTTSNLFALGCMPMVAFTHDTNSKLNISNDSGILVADLARGESLDFIQSKGFLTNEMQNMGKMYSDLVDESTVYDTAFGEAGAAGSFSEASLLSVSARLPLVSTQKQCGLAIGNTVALALEIMKERNINFKREDIEVKGSEIPDDIEVTCKLDMTQSQERLQRANEAAVILANGLASKKWTQENTIGIDNVEDMEKAMLNEKVTNSIVDYKIQEILADIQQEHQQKQQQKQLQLQQAVQSAQQAQQQAQVEQQQTQANEQAMLQQQQQANMGGSQNIPRGQQLESQILQQIQNAAMNNNMTATDAGQMLEGQAERLGGGGVAGGMPPEMGGMIPGMGGQELLQ